MKINKLSLPYLLCLSRCHGFIIPIRNKDSTRNAADVVTRTYLHNKGSDEDNDISIFGRFTSPVVDDPFLPLTDVSVAQIVAPSLEIMWLSLNHAPSPSWLRPIFDSSLLYQTRGSLVAPTLIHGAALASCWIVGALAAKAYQREAIAPIKSSGVVDFGRILIKMLQAGAFATGVLVFATQLDLFIEFGFRSVQPGESSETDFRLLTALVEVINDVFFEALSLTTWRLVLAYQNQRSA